MRLVKAASPWLLLLVFATLVNLKALPFFELFFKKLPLAVPVIPGQADPTRVLWQAYTWVLVATLVSAAFFKPTPRSGAAVLARTRQARAAAGLRRGGLLRHRLRHRPHRQDRGRPAPGSPTPANNMVQVLATAAAATFGSAVRPRGAVPRPAGGIHLGVGDQRHRHAEPLPHRDGARARQARRPSGCCWRRRAGWAAGWPR